MPGLPLVIAHRGASDTAPEHTLAAYEQALADGADGWECDVRLTADGHLVCVHDRRLDRTSNGRGAVSRRRLAELRQLDFSPARPGWEAPSEILTLERLLDFFVANRDGRTLLIETKHPSRFGGEVERVLVDMLRRFGLDKQTTGQPGGEVVVMSMWGPALRRIHDWAPGLPTTQLLPVTQPRSRLEALPSPIVGPRLNILRRNHHHVTRAHDAGKRVFVWTVDEPEDVELVVGLGVDVIITNRPRRVREQLWGPPA